MRIAGLALLALGLPAALPAQAISKDVMADWQRLRATVLEYIDAVPDSALGYRPTPGVRTLGEQFDHIVTTNLEVAAVALKGLKTYPKLGDSATFVKQKPALKKYAAATFDYVIDALKTASAAAVAKPVAMYGQAPQPAGRLINLSFEHMVWTFGQVVPYLRLNKVKPPAYQMPF